MKLLNIILLPLLLAGHAVASESVSLAGTWRFELDAKDLGEKERWFARDLVDTIPLPGTTDEAKKGAGNVDDQAMETLHPQLEGISSSACSDVELLIESALKPARDIPT